MTSPARFPLIWGLLVVTFVFLGIGSGVYWAVTKWPDHGVPIVLPPPSIQESSPLFRDQTAGSGIDFTYRNGEEADLFAAVEQLGGGVAMIDFDGDGLLDLFFTGGGYFDEKVIKGHPCRFFKNLGDWRFRDVTKEVGLDRIDFYTHGVAVADDTCDGRPDLLVTGYGRAALFRNVDGKRFVEVTEKAGLSEKAWCSSAGFADLTNGGFPDLYICHYVDWSFAKHPRCSREDGERDICGPRSFKPVVHSLYLNNRDGTFRDGSKEQELRDDGAGLGVLLADLNGDGRPDIFVANDQTPKHLYINTGGKLQETALLAGVAYDDQGLVNGSMGVDCGDYDGSGRPSLFVTNFENELFALYQNLGQLRFAYRSRSTGLGALSRRNVGWGAVFIDVMNHGWEDLLVVNGHVFRRPMGAVTQQSPVLLRNAESKGQRTFVDWSQNGGPYFAKPAIARGVAVGDLDNDGWPDVVVSHTNSRVAILRNIAFEGNPARWLGVKLIGRDDRDVTGTTVTLQGLGRTLTRFSKGGGSYLSANDRRILFGLGTSGKAGQLKVKWAWREEQSFDNLEPGAYWELREGEPTPRRIK